MMDINIEKIETKEEYKEACGIVWRLTKMIREYEDIHAAKDLLLDPVPYVRKFEEDIDD